MKVKKNVIKLSALALAGFISLGSTNIVTLANSVDPIEHNEKVDKWDNIFDMNKYFKDNRAEDGVNVNYIGNAVVLKHNAKYRNYSYSDIDELYKQAQMEREFRIFGNLQLTEKLTEVPEEVDTNDSVLNNVNLVIRDSEGNIIFNQTLNELLGMINNGYISINTEDNNFTYEFTLSNFADKDKLEWDLDLSRVFSEVVKDGDDNILKLYILLAPKGMTEEEAFPDFNDMWNIDKLYDDNQDDPDIFDVDKEDLSKAADLIKEEKEKEVKSEVNLKTLEERIAELKEQIIKLQEKIDALSKDSKNDSNKSDEKKAEESEEIKKLKEELEKAKKELDEINSKKDLKELNDKIDELRKEIVDMQRRRDGRREDRYDRYDRYDRDGRDGRDEENTEVKYEPIRGEFDEVDDNTLKKGEKAVVFYPIDGEKEITIETRIMNGLKVQRKSEKIIKKPQNGLVRIGTMTEEDKKTQNNQQNSQNNPNPQSTQAAVQGINMTGVQNPGFVQNSAQTYPQGVPTSPDRTMNRTSTATTRYTFPVGDGTSSNMSSSTTAPSETNTNTVNTSSVRTSKEGTKYYPSSDEATQAAIAAINESNGAYKSYTIHQSPDGNYYYSLSAKASKEVANQEAEKAQKQDVNLKTAANDPNTSKKLGAFLTMISSIFGAFFIFTKKRG